MDSEPGRSLILWTVRACVCFYAFAVWNYSSYATKRTTIGRAYRWTWFASWLLCGIHVGCAFHFEHHWSHPAAIEHTAKITERVLGLKWGGGIYANYLFLIWWGTDAFRQLSNSTPASSRTMHAAAAFMFLNATVVFGPAWWFVPVASFSAGLLAWCKVSKKNVRTG